MTRLWTVPRLTVAWTTWGRSASRTARCASRPQFAHTTWDNAVALPPVAGTAPAGHRVHSHPMARRT